MRVKGTLLTLTGRDALLVIQAAARCKETPQQWVTRILQAFIRRVKRK